MNTNIFYNDNKYIIKIEKDDIIGNIQDNILKKCSLMIYNIECSEVFLKNGEKYILGINDFLFDKNFNDNFENIDYFYVYDRKRDENGNVIKNNIIIDNYNKWFEQNENEKIINYYKTVKNDEPVIQNNNFISLFTNVLE